MESQRARSLTRTLLWCGVVAGPLFTVAFLLEGATRPDYSPIRHPVSSLALGPAGWTQTANFVVTGLLVVAYGIGIRRALREDGRRSFFGPLLIACSGIGLVGSGVFVTDPISGYPPGTPAVGDPTLTGSLHDLFALPIFLGWPIVFFVFARRFAGWGERRWVWYSLASGVAFVVLFVLASLGFSQVAGFAELGGLLQRATIVVGLAWLTLYAVHLLRAAKRR